MDDELVTGFFLGAFLMLFVWGVNSTTGFNVSPEHKEARITYEVRIAQEKLDEKNIKMLKFKTVENE